MLEQRIQQQFFDSADLSTQAAEVLSKPIADAAQALRRLHHRRRQGAGLRQRRLGQRRSALRGRVRRPLRTRAAGLAAIALTTDARSSRRSATTTTSSDLLEAGAGARRAGRRAAGHHHQRQIRPTCWPRRRGGARQGHDRRRADRPRRRRDARHCWPRPMCTSACRTSARRASRRSTSLVLHCLCDAVDLQLLGEQETDMNTRSPHRSLRARCAAAAAAGRQRWAAAPLLVLAAPSAARMMVSDRRTSGTQVEDQAIELKAQRASARLVGDRGHINVTSYNRMVLLTGEVATEADRSGDRAGRRAHRERALDRQRTGRDGHRARSPRAPTTRILTSKVKATWSMRRTCRPTSSRW